MKRISAFEAGGVRLRPLASEDLEATLAWRNRDDARKWFKTADRIGLEQHSGWFERYQRKDDDLVFIVEANGVAVGQVAVYDIDFKAATAEVGRFLVAPEAAGKGYLFAACRALVDYCHAKLALRKIYLEVFEDNQRAIRIYDAIGFVGISRKDGLLYMEKKFLE